MVAHVLPGIAVLGLAPMTTESAAQIAEPARPDEEDKHRLTTRASGRLGTAGLCCRRAT
jgi:hypothetical protein